eukprot:gene9505-6673_t
MRGEGKVFKYLCSGSRGKLYVTVTAERKGQFRGVAGYLALLYRIRCASLLSSSALYLWTILNTCGLHDSNVPILILIAPSILQCSAMDGSSDLFAMHLAYSLPVKKRDELQILESIAAVAGGSGGRGGLGPAPHTRMPLGVFAFILSTPPLKRSSLHRSASCNAAEARALAIQLSFNKRESIQNTNLSFSALYDFVRLVSVSVVNALVDVWDILPCLALGQPQHLEVFHEDKPSVSLRSTPEINSTGHGPTAPPPFLLWASRAVFDPRESSALSAEVRQARHICRRTPSCRRNACLPFASFRNCSPASSMAELLLFWADDMPRITPHGPPPSRIAPHPRTNRGAGRIAGDPHAWPPMCVGDAGAGPNTHRPTLAAYPTKERRGGCQRSDD